MFTHFKYNNYVVEFNSNTFVVFENSTKLEQYAVPQTVLEGIESSLRRYIEAENSKRTYIQYNDQYIRCTNQISAYDRASSPIPIANSPPRFQYYGHKDLIEIFNLSDKIHRLLIKTTVTPRLVNGWLMMVFTDREIFTIATMLEYVKSQLENCRYLSEATTIFKQLPLYDEWITFRFVKDTETDTSAIVVLSDDGAHKTIMLDNVTGFVSSVSPSKELEADINEKIECGTI
jgi:hypothetical protein